MRVRAQVLLKLKGQNSREVCALAPGRFHSAILVRLQPMLNGKDGRSAESLFNSVKNHEVPHSVREDCRTFWWESCEEKCSKFQSKNWRIFHARIDAPSPQKYCLSLHQFTFIGPILFLCWCGQIERGRLFKIVKRVQSFSLAKERGKEQLNGGCLLVE